MGEKLIAGSGQLENQQYWMKSKNGVELTEVERTSLLSRLDGLTKVGVLGYTPMFEINSAQYGPSKKTNVLFQVLDGAQKGQRFSLMFGYSVGANAKLNEVIKAARGHAVESGEEFDLDTMIGMKLGLLTITEKSAKGYDTIFYKGAQPLDNAAPPSPQPAMATVGAADGEFDPFADESI